LNESKTLIFAYNSDWRIYMFRWYGINEYFHR